MSSSESTPIVVTDDVLKAAFCGEYSSVLSQIEINELWENVKEYAHFKAQMRINKKKLSVEPANQSVSTESHQ